MLSVVIALPYEPAFTKLLAPITWPWPYVNTIHDDRNYKDMTTETSGVLHFLMGMAKTWLRVLISRGLSWAVLFTEVLMSYAYCDWLTTADQLLYCFRFFLLIELNARHET